MNAILHGEEDIDYSDSIHTKQLQRSQYVKIDDNLLNFKFDAHEAVNQQTKQLSDDQVAKMNDEITKVHLKYLSIKDVT